MTSSSRRVLVLAGNSGLGLGLVDGLLKNKAYEVFASYRGDRENLSGVFDSNGLRSAGRVLCADLTSYEQTAAAVSAVSSGGPLWAIVNLAGTSSAKRLARLDADDAKSILLDSALPALFATKCALETMPNNGLDGGRVIHFSSVTVRRPVPGAVPYIAGKAAVEGIVRSAAEEGGRHNITVNALRLGYFSAGMTVGVPSTILEGVIASSATRRLGAPADLLAAVSYLLSPDSSFQTGTITDLDGGLV